MRKSDFLQTHLLFHCCWSCDPGRDSSQAKTLGKKVFGGTMTTLACLECRRGEQEAVDAGDSQTVKGLQVLTLVKCVACPALPVVFKPQELLKPNILLGAT